MNRQKILKKISPVYNKLDSEVKPKLNSLESAMRKLMDNVNSKIDFINSELNVIREKIDKIVDKDNLSNTFSKEKGFSHLDEENIIEKYLESLPGKNKFCVDIAASDGMTMSNTLFLFKKGWNGIAVEYDAEMFARLSFLYKVFPEVSLVKTKITPENIINLLKSCLCPKNFSFLSFDIDGYDFFVLDKLLSEFRPQLICTEINESIPPPIKFTVKYDPDHMWNVDLLFGQSISKFYELCEKYKYDIVELYYNNIFVIPSEINKHEALSPEKAYEIGYKNKTDRIEKFPWSAKMEEIWKMSKGEAINHFNRELKKYKGKYILE